MLLELLKKTRTYRRFDNSKIITDEALCSIVESVRYTASAGNLQRIRYVTLSRISAIDAFSHVSLGGYLPKEKKPCADVAPTSYIVMLTESVEPDVNLSIDIGICAEAIALCAAELGIGACMIRNFDREYFASFTTGMGYYPALVVALGYPAESVKICDAKVGESLKYYKNENETNVVPKLQLEDLIINKFN